MTTATQKWYNIYKTIVPNDEEKSWMEDLRLALDKQTWCCKDLENSVGLYNSIDFIGRELRLIEPDHYDGGYNHSSIPLSFCPFCGEKIEYVEAKRVKRVLRTKKIKPQPAREEKYWAEITIKEKK